MIDIIDPGHVFRLLTLDGEHSGDADHLTFVKRQDKKDWMKFPGNHDSYPGTTLQSVLRACHSRVSYLNGQHHCEENIAIMQHLRAANYLLEKRAARRHNREFPYSADEAIDMPMCPMCGHITCDHNLVNEK